MAEYVEVMKQKKRMCKKYTGGGICQSIDYNICPLKGHELCSKPILLINIDKIQECEEIIMRWAAENPEQVYPTWGEWLLQQGVIRAGTESRNGFTYQTVHDKLFDPIDAETAEKLGLRPKEDI